MKAVLASLAVAVLTVSGVGYAFVGRVGGDLASVGNLDLGASGNSESRGDGKKKEGFSDGALDILMVGSDSRTDAQGNTLSEQELAALHAGVDSGEENTDTIMVIRIPKDGSRATAISIPRDTYVADDEFGNMKINGVYGAHALATREKLVAENDAAHASGEPPVHTPSDIESAAVQAGRSALFNRVKSLTGIDIDHYAEIGLVGFVLLTDAVGGVDVCLNNPVNDPMSGADFPAGRQTLQGAQGLAFVRQRYELPRGDLDRIVRQQAYAASLVNKLLSSGTLTNPAKLSRISKAVERSVVLDENWDVMSLANQLSGLAGGNITFATIPVTSIDGVGDYGESIVTVDVAEVHRFFEELAKTREQTAADAPQPPAPAADGEAAPAIDPNLEIHVLNAGSISGLAAGVGAWITSQGYAVDRTANADPGIYDTTQLVAANPDDPRAIALAEQLGGIPITVNEGLDPNTLIVVTANDYAGPSDQDETDAASAAEEMAPAPVGAPGADFGEAEVSPEIDAGGDGPRCVN
ncbi:LytR family transcriptional regulator [Corynebacterium phocae]|uniref:LytR family transcriptional regulator n=1 Tax=Corynebacterium phocae TaxID=161895 RepID=A0A1L7D6K8_9CORY|nr:LCP family protein [Corynebacterium phocae]APT93774.1 LytR family transcriptional regulator [Corynebacterium phocae]KAA8722415.1 LytR family transcriptional regulator [Corynebacterium phocae]